MPSRQWLLVALQHVALLQQTGVNVLPMANKDAVLEFAKAE